MAIHKFAVGQSVYFSPDRGQKQVKGERFKIIRWLPQSRQPLQYEVKSEADCHERVTREDQFRGS